MADRFPSIEDIDEDQTFEYSNNAGADDDDFLARERAVLGDEANQFGVPSVSAPDGDGDLLGGGVASPNDADIDAFQSSFPAVDTRNEAMAPGGTITGATSPFLPGAPTQTSSTTRAYSPAPYATEEEPEVIKEWRERRNADIEKREQASATRKTATVEAAQGAIDEFYENYNRKKEKGVAQTRREAEEFLAKREDTAAGGTSWERIGKLVDVRPGAGKAASGQVVGKERFRELLGNLMKDENAPGAKGY